MTVFFKPTLDISNSQFPSWQPQLHPHLEQGRSHVLPAGNIISSYLKESGENPSLSQILKRKYGIRGDHWAQNFFWPSGFLNMTYSHACSHKNQSQLFSTSYMSLYSLLWPSFQITLLTTTFFRGSGTYLSSLGLLLPHEKPRKRQFKILGPFLPVTSWRGMTRRGKLCCPIQYPLETRGYLKSLKLSNI